MIDLLRFLNIGLSLAVVFFYAKLFISMFLTKVNGKENNTKWTMLLLFGILLSSAIIQFVFYQLSLAQVLDSHQMLVLMNVRNLIGNILLIICGYLLIAINKGKL